MDPSATVSQGFGVLFGLGLPGVVIAGLAFVVWLQYNRNNVLTDKIIEMGATMATAMANQTAAMNRQSDILIAERNAK